MDSESCSNVPRLIRLREALGAPLYRPFELLSQFWSVWMDSNHRPRAYQARALAT